MEEETERHLSHGRRNFCHVHQEVVMVRRQLAVHRSPRVALQTGRAKGHTEAAHPSVPRTPPRLCLPPRPGHTPPELLSCLFPSAGGKAQHLQRRSWGLRGDPNRHLPAGLLGAQPGTNSSGVGFPRKGNYHRISNRRKELEDNDGRGLPSAVTLRYAAFLKARATVRKATSSN